MARRRPRERDRPARDGSIHLRRTSGVTGRASLSTGLSPDRVADVRSAAELHDVGKVAIPDDILEKPSALSDEEWTFMRRHTLIGARIVAAAPALDRVAPLVRSSHERWDGRGYPDGLAGEEIPLGARIVAVCDAFHAMTSDRPYGQALDPEMALEELERCAGTQFDPAVVGAFRRAVDDLRAGRTVAGRRIPVLPPDRTTLPAAS